MDYLSKPDPRAILTERCLTMSYRMDFWPIDDEFFET